MPRAVIIGGGIGGLTTGLSLKKAGWEALVCEAAPALRPVGKGIWVPTNAMTVLAKLGLADQVAAEGWALSGIDLRTVDGKTLGSFDLEDVRNRLGFTTISIHRARLIGVLAGALGRETLRLNARFNHVEENANSLVVHMEDGSSLETDLLVGADGLKSSVRQWVQPEVKLLDSGQSCARGVARMRLPASLATRCQEIWGGRFRFGFSAIGQDEVYWFAPFSDPKKEKIKTVREFMLDRYGSFPAVVLEILRNTPEEEIILTRLEELPKLNGWSKGRVQLVGDAAHAMTPNLGQGGAQAMEDGFFLGKELEGLESGKTGIEGRLSEYSRKRYVRVRPIVKTARLFGQVAHWENPFGCWIRDSLLRMTPGRINQARLLEMYKMPEG